MDILAFSAHPDDVELSCGGTLIKLIKMGYRVGIIDITRSELSSNGTVEQRKREAEDARRILGAEIRENLEIPDGNIEPNWENKKKVISVIREYRAPLLFVPYWDDRHPDHSNTSKLVSEASFLSGLKKIETKQAAFRPEQIIYYMCYSQFIPDFIIDISKEYAQKIEVLKQYKSQFTREEDKIPTLINQPDFLDIIKNRAKYYGKEIRVTYGEPFLVKNVIQVDDPVKQFIRNRLR